MKVFFKKSIILIVVSIFMLSFAQNDKHTLTIEINELRSNDGKVLLGLMDANEKIIREIGEKIINNKCIIEITDLQPGKYAFKYLHDENNNEEMDFNWMKIPQEGYGFSNNAKGAFGPPDFEDTIIELKSNVKVKCTATYF